MSVPTRTFFALSAAATVLLLAGCGGKVVTSLGGTTWTYAQSVCGYPPSKITVDFEEDGRVDETLTFSTPISGAMHMSGLSWSVSSNSMNISGTPTCSGGFTEGVDTPYLGSLNTHACSSPRLPIGCGLDPNAAGVPGGMATQVVGVGCDYTLSSNGAVLTLQHCEESPPTSPAPLYPGAELPGGYFDYTLHAE